MGQFDNQDEIVSVKNFGAKGDGITNDNLAFKDAIAYLQVLGGGKLYVPEGTYIVEEIQVFTNNITIQGSGWNSIIKLVAGVESSDHSGNCIHIRDCDNTVIKDMRLDGDRPSQLTLGAAMDAWLNGIRMAGVNGVVVDNVWSTNNGYHGIIMVPTFKRIDGKEDKSTIERWAENITVKNSKFTLNGYRPFHGHSGLRNSYFLNNYCEANAQGVSNSPTKPLDAIFFFDRIYDVTIAGNIVKNPISLAGINVGGSMNREGVPEYAGPSERIKVVDNMVIGKPEDPSYNVTGILLFGKDLNDCEVSGNIINGCYRGLETSSAYEIGENIRIENNDFLNCHSRGILVFNFMRNSKIKGNTVRRCSSHGIELVVADTDISGNMLIDNGSPTQSLYDAIRLTGASTNNIIKSNIITNTKGATNYQRYGIVETGVATDDNIIEQNTIKNNSGWIPINKSGANTKVRYNEGHKTENKGQTTITSGTTLKTVTHGLNLSIGVVPKLEDIQITPLNNLGKATKYWVSDPTNKKFTVNVDVEPDRDANFAWQIETHI